MQNWGVKQGIKLSTKNIGERDGVINYPLYMAMFLQHLTPQMQKNSFYGKMYMEECGKFCHEKWQAR